MIVLAAVNSNRHARHDWDVWQASDYHHETPLSSHCGIGLDKTLEQCHMPCIPQLCVFGGLDGKADCMQNLSQQLISA